MCSSDLGAEKAVVITGGFHTGPFREFFERQGFNYALLSPHFTSNGGREAYLRALLQDDFKRVAFSTLESPDIADGPHARLRLGENLVFAARETAPLIVKAALARKIVRMVSPQAAFHLNLKDAGKGEGEVVFYPKGWVRRNPLRVEVSGGRVQAVTAMTWEDRPVRGLSPPRSEARQSDGNASSLPGRAGSVVRILKPGPEAYRNRPQSDQDEKNREVAVIHGVFISILSYFSAIMAMTKQIAEAAAQMAKSLVLNIVPGIRLRIATVANTAVPRLTRIFEMLARRFSVSSNPISTQSLPTIDYGVNLPSPSIALPRSEVRAIQDDFNTASGLAQEAKQAESEGNIRAALQRYQGAIQEFQKILGTTYLEPGEQDIKEVVKQNVDVLKQKVNQLVAIESGEDKKAVLLAKVLLRDGIVGTNEDQAAARKIALEILQIDEASSEHFLARSQLFAEVLETNYLLGLQHVGPRSALRKIKVEKEEIKELKEKIVTRLAARKKPLEPSPARPAAPPAPIPAPAAGIPPSPPTVIPTPPKEEAPKAEAVLPQELESIAQQLHDWYTGRGGKLTLEVFRQMLTAYRAVYQKKGHVGVMDFGKELGLKTKSHMWTRKQILKKGLAAIGLSFDSLVKDLQPKIEPLTAAPPTVAPPAEAPAAPPAPGAMHVPTAPVPAPPPVEAPPTPAPQVAAPPLPAEIEAIADELANWYHEQHPSAHEATNKAHFLKLILAYREIYEILGKTEKISPRLFARRAGYSGHTGRRLMERLTDALRGIEKTTDDLIRDVDPLAGRMFVGPQSYTVEELQKMIRVYRDLYKIDAGKVTNEAFARRMGRRPSTGQRLKRKFLVALQRIGRSPEFLVSDIEIEEVPEKAPPAPPSLPAPPVLPPPPVPAPAIAPPAPGKVFDLEKLSEDLYQWYDKNKKRGAKAFSKDEFKKWIEAYRKIYSEVGKVGYRVLAERMGVKLSRAYAVINQILEPSLKGVGWTLAALERTAPLPPSQTLAPTTTVSAPAAEAPAAPPVPPAPTAPPAPPALPPAPPPVEAAPPPAPVPAEKIPYRLVFPSPVDFDQLAKELAESYAKVKPTDAPQILAGQFKEWALAYLGIYSILGEVPMDLFADWTGVSKDRTVQLADRFSSYNVINAITGRLAVAAKAWGAQKEGKPFTTYPKSFKNLVVTLAERLAKSQLTQVPSADEFQRMIRTYREQFVAKGQASIPVLESAMARIGVPMDVLKYLERVRPELPPTPPPAAPVPPPAPPTPPLPPAPPAPSAAPPTAPAAPAAPPAPVTPARPSLKPPEEIEEVTVNIAGRIANAFRLLLSYHVNDLLIQMIVQAYRDTYREGVDVKSEEFVARFAQRLGGVSLDNAKDIIGKIAAAFESLGGSPAEIIHDLPFVPPLPVEKELKVEADTSGIVETIYRPGIAAAFRKEELDKVLQALRNLYRESPVTEDKIEEFANQRAAEIAAASGLPQDRVREVIQAIFAGIRAVGKLPVDLVYGIQVPTAAPKPVIPAAPAVPAAPPAPQAPAPAPPAPPAPPPIQYDRYDLGTIVFQSETTLSEQKAGKLKADLEALVKAYWAVVMYKGYSLFQRPQPFSPSDVDESYRPTLGELAQVLRRTAASVKTSVALFNKGVAKKQALQLWKPGTSVRIEPSSEVEIVFTRHAVRKSDFPHIRSKILPAISVVIHVSVPPPKMPEPVDGATLPQIFKFFQVGLETEGVREWALYYVILPESDWEFLTQFFTQIKVFVSPAFDYNEARVQEEFGAGVPRIISIYNQIIGPQNIVKIARNVYRELHRASTSNRDPSISDEVIEALLRDEESHFIDLLYRARLFFTRNATYFNKSFARRIVVEMAKNQATGDTQERSLAEFLGNLNRIVDIPTTGGVVEAFIKRLRAYHHIHRLNAAVQGQILDFLRRSLEYLKESDTELKQKSQKWTEGLNQERETHIVKYLQEPFEGFLKEVEKAQEEFGTAERLELHGFIQGKLEQALGSIDSEEPAFRAIQHLVTSLEISPEQALILGVIATDPKLAQINELTQTQRKQLSEKIAARLQMPQEQVMQHLEGLRFDERLATRLSRQILGYAASLVEQTIGSATGIVNWANREGRKVFPDPEEGRQQFQALIDDARRSAARSGKGILTEREYELLVAVIDEQRLAQLVRENRDSRPVTQVTQEIVTALRKLGLRYIDLQTLVKENVINPKLLSFLMPKKLREKHIEEFTMPGTPPDVVTPALKNLALWLGVEAKQLQVFLLRHGEQLTPEGKLVVVRPAPPPETEEEWKAREEAERKRKDEELAALRTRIQDMALFALAGAHLLMEDWNASRDFIRDTVFRETSAETVRLLFGEPARLEGDRLSQMNTQDFDRMLDQVIEGLGIGPLEFALMWAYNSLKSTSLEVSLGKLIQKARERYKEKELERYAEVHGRIETLNGALEAKGYGREVIRLTLVRPSRGEAEEVITNILGRNSLAFQILSVYFDLFEEDGLPPTRDAINDQLQQNARTRLDESGLSKVIETINDHLLEAEKTYAPLLVALRPFTPRVIQIFGVYKNLLSRGGAEKPIFNFAYLLVQMQTTLGEEAEKKLLRILLRHDTGEEVRLIDKVEPGFEKAMLEVVAQARERQQELLEEVEEEEFLAALKVLEEEEKKKPEPQEPVEEAELPEAEAAPGPTAPVPVAEIPAVSAEALSAEAEALFYRDTVKENLAPFLSSKELARAAENPDGYYQRFVKEVGLDEEKVRTYLTELGVVLPEDFPVAWAFWKAWQDHHDPRGRVRLADISLHLRTAAHALEISQIIVALSRLNGRIESLTSNRTEAPGSDLVHFGTVLDEKDRYLITLFRRGAGYPANRNVPYHRWIEDEALKEERYPFASAREKIPGEIPARLRLKLGFGPLEWRILRLYVKEKNAQDTQMIKLGILRRSLEADSLFQAILSEEGLSLKEFDLSARMSAMNKVFLEAFPPRGDQSRRMQILFFETPALEPSEENGQRPLAQAGSSDILLRVEMPDLYSAFGFTDGKVHSQDEIYAHLSSLPQDHYEKNRPYYQIYEQALTGQPVIPIVEVWQTPERNTRGEKKEKRVEKKIGLKDYNQIYANSHLAKVFQVVPARAELRQAIPLPARLLSQKLLWNVLTLHRLNELLRRFGVEGVDQMMAQAAGVTSAVRGVIRPQAVAQDMSQDLEERSGFLAALFGDRGFRAALQNKTGLAEEALQFGGAGEIVLSTSGDSFTQTLELLSLALPFYARLTTVDGRGKPKQVITFAGDPENTRRVKDLILNRKANGLTPEALSRIGQLFKFDLFRSFAESVDLTLRQGVQALAVAAPSKEVASIQDLIPKAIEEAFDLNETSLSRAELAEAYYFRNRLLVDLASKVGQLKDSAGLAVAIRAYLEKNLPDIYQRVNVSQRDGSFSISLALISQQLNLFREVYRSLQSAA